MGISRTSLERRIAALACGVFLTAGGGAPHAQAPQQPAAPVAPVAQQTAPAPAVPQPSPYPKVTITAGRSTVLTVNFNIVRFSVTNPAVADASVVSPHEVLVDGKAPGTISLIVWGENTRLQYDVDVEPPISGLQQNLTMLFPGEDIHVSGSDQATVLSGKVSSTDVMLRVGEIAKAATASHQVINLLQVPGGSESQQVLLQVRFAEVNRNVLKELGVNFFTTGNGNHNTWGSVTTGQFPSPTFSNLTSTKTGSTVTSQSGDLNFSDFLNLFFLNAKYDIGAVVQALENTGKFQSLAEPNLIAYNGQEASFLAGGEFPVPVVQGATGTVTVVFKEYGVRLTFTPTIAGDVIRLKVAPEVSALDFNNGVTLNGFRIPALTTRRAETDVELRDGQSFAIAGLLDNVTQDNKAAIPYLAKLPIIGDLFKSTQESDQQTELMVLITPRLVKPLDPDEVPPLPTQFKPFPMKKDDGKTKDKKNGGTGTGTSNDPTVGLDLQGTGTVDAPAPPSSPAKAPAKKTGGQ